MVRPCVARGFVELASAVLHQCIRPLIGACAPGHHGYQRACDLISGQASPGQKGHQCSHAPGRPILHLYPLADLGWKRLIRLRHRLLLISRSSFVRAEGPFLRPGPQNVDRVAPEPRREDQAGRTPASSVLVSSKARPFASTAQAMRASLLASAIASTLWCNRLLAASIQDLSP
jgi:hypothetical protein